MKILQIIPETRFTAVYNENGEEVSYPVVCWALIEKEFAGEIYQEVIGMIVIDTDPELQFVVGDPDSGNFVRYELN
jgi:hypothetical protein